jgi:hypothetical protein
MYLFICAMNAPHTRRMMSKYLLTLVYNRLNNVSKLRMLYWYTGICMERECVARLARVNPNETDGDMNEVVQIMHAMDGF